MGARSRVMAVGAIALVAAGCQAIGPASIKRDRLDYSGAIASSWREQTLLNIVKLRYFDAPVFLEVSSVISSYTLQGDVSLSSRIFPFARTDTFHEAGVTGTYTDRPTITYTPVTGEKYIDKLLRPIPPQAIFAMIQAGHQADYILALTVRAINEVYNYSAAPARRRQEDPAFFRVIEALHRIQQSGALGIRIEKQGGKDVTFIFFREKVSPDVAEDIRFLRETLGIKPEIKEIPLRFGLPSPAGGEMALLTRSMWEIFAELSAGVDVPAHDTAEGRATQAPHPSVRPRGSPIARIHSSDEPPSDAYAVAHYRNRWFWVDDRDLASKRVFTFLMVFSSIAEAGAVPQVPVITIPAR